MYYYSQQHDLAVAQIPKAGLQTISEWLQPGFRLVNNDEAVAASRRVAFIRHPLARLRSCYQMFYWMTKRGTQHSCKAPLESWESFVDWVLDSDGTDEHWLPQAEVIGNTPNIYRKFERLGECFEEYMPGYLPHNNRSTKLDINEDYRRAELEAYYASDLALWEAAE